MSKKNIGWPFYAAVLQTSGEWQESLASVVSVQTIEGVIMAISLWFNEHGEGHLSGLAQQEQLLLYLQA